MISYYRHGNVTSGESSIMKFFRWPWGKPKIADYPATTEIKSTYPRYTYLVTWTYLPEPRRPLSPNALHFTRQLTRRQMGDVVRALNSRDAHFRCTMKSVTGQPARVALSATSLQRIMD